MVHKQKRYVLKKRLKKTPSKKRLCVAGWTTISISNLTISKRTTIPISISNLTISKKRLCRTTISISNLTISKKRLCVAGWTTISISNYYIYDYEQGSLTEDLKFLSSIQNMAKLFPYSLAPLPSIISSSLSPPPNRCDNSYIFFYFVILFLLVPVIHRINFLLSMQ